MARITLARETLDELDRLEHDTLVATLFVDERPLRGINGLVDWRMNGSLSRMLKAKRITGELGEKTLTTSGGRLPALRILMFGLGERGAFDNMAFVNAVDTMVATLLKLKPNGIALTIPGAHRESDFVLERLAILLKALHSRFDGPVTLFVSRKENYKDFSAKFELIQKEVANVLKHDGRRKG